MVPFHRPSSLQNVTALLHQLQCPEVSEVEEEGVEQIQRQAALKVCVCVCVRVCARLGSVVGEDDPARCLLWRKP